MGEPVKLGDVLKIPTADPTGTDATCADCGAAIPNALGPDVPAFLRASAAKRARCPACAERHKAEREAERRQAEADEAARLEAERLRALDALRADLPGVLASIGVPPRWMGATFDRCGDLPGDLVGTVQAWAAEPNGTLVFVGGVGSGKTYLATAALRAILDAGIYAPGQCGFAAERLYLDALRAEAGGDLGRVLDGPAGPRLAGLPFLVFDDLAASRVTDFSRDAIAGLVEARHGACLPTIYTTNLDLGQIATTLDGRTASRLVEDGQVILFPARDLRVDGTITKARRASAGRPGEDVEKAR